jgi:hypothetical protein
VVESGGAEDEGREDGGEGCGFAVGDAVGNGLLLGGKGGSGGGVLGWCRGHIARRYEVVCMRKASSIAAAIFGTARVVCSDKEERHGDDNKVLLFSARTNLLAALQQVGVLWSPPHSAQVSNRVATLDARNV